MRALNYNTVAAKEPKRGILVKITYFYFKRKMNEKFSCKPIA